MVLSEDFKEYFPDKVVQSVNFVAEDDPELLNNPRNDCMKILVSVYRHKTLPVRPIACTHKSYDQSASATCTIVPSQAPLPRTHFYQT